MNSVNENYAPFRLLLENLQQSDGRVGRADLALRLGRLVVEHARILVAGVALQLAVQLADGGQGTFQHLQEPAAVVKQAAGDFDRLVIGFGGALDGLQVGAGHLAHGSADIDELMKRHDLSWTKHCDGESGWVAPHAANLAKSELKLTQRNNSNSLLSLMLPFCPGQFKYALNVALWIQPAHAWPALRTVRISQSRRSRP